MNTTIITNQPAPVAVAPATTGISVAAAQIPPAPGNVETLEQALRNRLEGYLGSADFAAMVFAMFKGVNEDIHTRWTTKVADLPAKAVDIIWVSLRRYADAGL